jgi:hypothetical protein
MIRLLNSLLRITDWKACLPSCCHLSVEPLLLQNYFSRTRLSPNGAGSQGSSPNT